MRPADDFPQDDSGYGFDNIADVLSLSPGLMEKYMLGGRQGRAHGALRAAGAQADAHAAAIRGDATADARTFPADYDVTGLSLPNAFHAIQRVPVDGEYLIKVALSGVRPQSIRSDRHRALGRRAPGDDR